MNSTSGSKVVTLALPIYRRLTYVPSVLKIVEQQDYPAIELIVSDNGCNGTKVQELVQANYHRPYRFRQSPRSVDVTSHFNQIIEEGNGDYFVILSDDDEISPNFISELVRQLELHPNATAAIPRLELINVEGKLIRQSKDNFPEFLSGSDFIHALWGSYEFQLECVSTFVMRMDKLRACGGYPNFKSGNHIDDGLLVKLCLGHQVVFGRNCVFRWRIEESSNGWSTNIWDLALCTRQFMRFLDDDPTIRAFASAHPGEWAKSRAILRRMAWETYLWRWRDIYRKRLSGWEWARAAFGMPFIREYYRRAGSILKEEAKRRLTDSFRRVPKVSRTT